jgi:hypothetical protein
MKKLVMAAMLALVGCGADGPPVTPSANIGLNIGPGGITPQASAGITAGILSLGVNL